MDTVKAASSCELTSVATVEVGEGVVRESKGIESGGSTVQLASSVSTTPEPRFPLSFQEGVRYPPVERCAVPAFF